MGRRSSPIEQACGCKNGDAGTKRHDSGATRMGPNQIADKVFGDGLLDATPARHHDQVRSPENASTCGSSYDQPARGGQRPLFNSANRIAIPIPAQFRSRQPEHFGSDPEFEGAEPVIRQDDDEGSGGSWLCAWHDADEAAILAIVTQRGPSKPAADDWQDIAAICHSCRWPGVGRWIRMHEHQRRSST